MTPERQRLQQLENSMHELDQVRLNHLHVQTWPGLVREVRVASFRLCRAVAMNERFHSAARSASEQQTRFPS